MSVLLLLATGCIEGTIDNIDEDTVDGITDGELTSQYANCNGSSRVDDDLDGVFEETHQLGYDDWGNMIRYTSDFDLDGLNDLVYLYEVTPSGEPLVTEKDEDGDGDGDMVWTYLRDDDEWLEFVEYDEGADGELDWLTTVTTLWTDDQKPERVTSDKDELLDGTVDEREVRVYTYDDTGYWVAVESDYQADGTLEARYEVRYDADDLKQEVRFDYSADGFVDMVQEFHYTEDGQVHRIDVIGYEIDGSTSLTYVFHEYDDEFRVTEINRDDGGDGSLDGATTFVWDCQ
jgi:hypothetical protein